MRIFRCRQGSQEWFDLRSGRLTASVLHRALTSRGQVSRSLDRLISELADERLGIFSEPFCSPEMKRGTKLEAEAREEFELWWGARIEQVGFCLHDSGLVGCSPDGLMPDLNLGLEIKCPTPRVFKCFASRQVIPARYVMQVQGSMYVTGYKFWYFMAYHPNFDPMILKISFNAKIGQKLEELVFKTEARLKTLGLPLREVS